ncbi:MAG: hypothetical protein ACUVV0_00305 [Anaerolineae bacterium]
MKAKYLMLTLFVTLALSACAPAHTYQAKWPTPVGTFTPTPKPQATLPPTPTRLFECISWHQARNYVGREICVEGGVIRVEKSEEAFLVNFSEDRTAFCGVSFDYDLSHLANKCVRIQGTIETYKGRPAIIIKSLDQILPCLGHE